ncbi:MAG: hypothetical protein LOD84_09005, partial [Limnochordales bacterium]
MAMYAASFTMGTGGGAVLMGPVVAAWGFEGAFRLASLLFSVLLLIFFAQLLVNKRSLFNVAGKRVLGLDFPRLRDLGPI